MRVNAIAMSLLVSLVATTQDTYAQVTDLTSESFLQAALTVMTFDHFASKCQQGRGFTASDANKIEVWQTTNGVNKIRTRLRDFEQHPVQKQQLNQAVSQITEKIAGTNINACAAAVLVSQLPEAQFAKVSPQLLTPVNSSPNIPTKVEQSTPSTSVANASFDPKILNQIDSFGFNSRTKMGVGGFLTLDIYPIVLFRNGDALTNVGGLAFTGGLEAHKRAKPDEWTRWRSQNGKLQIARKSGWEALPFQTTYPKLPTNFKLNGLFRLISGTGTVAIGGSQSVTAWQDYNFSPDGRVVRGGGTGGRAESGNSSVTTSSAAPNQRGRYRIEGLTLHITYDDGSSERRILITDPKNPKSAIWLDGIGYVRRN
jgi:hypothetical protein